MRNLIVLLLFLTLLQNIAFPQSCLPEGITFTTQAQIDSFPVNYPDCYVIEGDVTINDEWQTISNLDGLNSITIINGSLAIGNITLLFDLAGLQNLASIYGDLKIGYEDTSGIYGTRLLSLTGLEWMDIGGDLFIGYNDSLEGLEGLQYLSNLGGSLSIKNNSALNTLIQLQNLNSIGGNLDIIGNNSLVSLMGLENVLSGSIGDLHIYNNPGLICCDIYPICSYLEDLSGIVEIHDNAEGCNSADEIIDNCSNNCLPGGLELLTQEDIDHFRQNYPGCEEIDGYLHIGNYLGSNTSITNLDSLSVLTCVRDDLGILDCDSLVSLEGLNGIVSVWGSLSIDDNAILIHLNGMDNLTLVGRSLGIGDPGGGNESLVDLVGLDKVQTVGRILGIEHNPLLNSLHGLEKLVHVGSQLIILENPSLQDLTGLSALEYVGGSLYIRGENLLENLSGLNALTATGGEIWIRNNSHLKNLQGLDNLISIGGQLTLVYNDSLNSLTGIESLDAGSINDLEIYYNPFLCDCAVQSICDYVKSPGGDLNIHDNGHGCNSPEEVDSACVYLSNDVEHFQYIFSIFPNPSSSEIIIEIPGISGKTDLVIFNLSGQEMARQQISNPLTVFDISYLTGGIYFVKASDESKVLVGKFVKR